MPYADPEQNRQYHREYDRTWNPDARKRIGKKYDDKRNQTDGRKRQLAEVRQRRHVRQRVAVLKRYGGRCSFCGTTQYEHMTIDHTNGDGKAHREEFIPRYRNIYDFLYNTEFRPDLFRILCWNCHMAWTRYGVAPGGEELHDLDWWESFGALRREPNGSVRNE